MSPAWTSARLDGQLYGRPVVADGRVVAATEDDSVYALSVTTGRVLWSTRLAKPVPATALPCGDITPTVGITGTPVIDLARQEVFAVAEELVGGRASHHLVGLSLSTGKVLLDEPADPPGADPAALLQRTGLAMAGTAVVWGYGGNYGDCGSYHGWVMAAPAGGGAIRHHEDAAVPGGREAAVWMGGAAPEVTAAGHIWVAEGNGAATTPSHYDGSDSVVELSRTLRVLATFTPRAWAADNARDEDIGSSAPALLADGRVVQVGKTHEAYELSTARMDGVGNQVASTPACAGAQVDGGDAVTGTTVYVGCQQGVEALVAGATTIGVKWTTTAPAGGPPLLAGGLVWSVGSDDLYGLRPSSGRAAVTLRIGGNANDFPAASSADGLLLVTGGGGSEVLAFSGAQPR